MNNYTRGLKAGIPIALGYLSVSFTFGINEKITTCHIGRDSINTAYLCILLYSVLSKIPREIASEHISLSKADIRNPLSLLAHERSRYISSVCAGCHNIL